MAAVLRGMMSDLFQISGTAQTPEEIETALTRSGAEPSLSAEVRTLLGQCDDVRYGRDNSADRPRAPLLQAMERLMRSPRWVSA